jgi:ubiquinone/menaquinone biosynthesis C-methylase UbiE
MTDSRKPSVDWDHDVYSKGKQLNNWPFTDIIPDILSVTSGKDRETLRFLEIGCGAGNNLWFAAEAGFSVAGIDISPTAINHSRERLSLLGHESCDLKVGHIAHLPWPDEYFDIVLDRGTLTMTSYADIRACVSEVLRVLRPGGCMLGYSLFGHNSSDRQYGTRLSENTYDHFTSGYFTKGGLTSFFDENDLRDMFGNFSDINITRHTSTNLASNHVRETYSIICHK